MHLHVVCSSSRYNWGNAKFLQFFFKNHGWEFAHQFFEQIASFLWAKEQKIHLRKRANHSHCYFVKSDGHSFVMRDGSDLLLSIKKGKNCQKHTENIIFWANRSFFVSIKAICSWNRANHLLLFSKVQQERFAHGRIFLKSDMNDLLTVTLFKEPQEQSALSCSLKWGILSKRVKSKEQKCEEWKSKIPTMSKTKERYPCKVLNFQKNTRGKILKKTE